MTTTDTDVQTERAKRSERYSSGEPRVKMAIVDDSPAAPAVNGRRCFVCGTTTPGDSFTVLPDEKGIPRSIHVHTHSSVGKAVEITPDCLKSFESRLADANRQRAREQQEDLALAAQNRKFPAPAPRGIDCLAPDCSRFFDSQNGVDLHYRRQHKID